MQAREQEGRETNRDNAEELEPFWWSRWEPVWVVASREQGRSEERGDSRDEGELRQQSQADA